jgi:3-oxoacyl-[acyl-carrier-protein] synthase-3
MEFVSYANEGPPCMYYGGVMRKDGTMAGLRLIDNPEELLQLGYLSLTQNVEALRKHLPEGFRKACVLAQAKHQLQADDIDWLLPHYSSEGFRQPLFDGLEQAGFRIPEERWFTNLKSKGNTGSASIYIILEELMSSGRVRPGDRIVCAVPESSRFSFAILHLTAVTAPSQTSA